ncbi:hypothetical protein C488_02371 [Natrinema pellirubrum DSM 15624]|uniref:Phage PhiH1 repressor protein n=1 Tax=Natrinema pellirubrum (strain DSM 15624 / CIP 106293 / JCM 10476 / NCIMB 786 / 157) TaxID=797303 RepID=L0JKY6_NATP1|nr:hypothetical protein [Natrinema pellirubrum]AGB31021.1 hypothetical protein Natpe_1109 [Natrinema pellirubrum DSM 15624]ELY81134.1 hypothetical protein C488_02371 [Natrinema pellirubrum DSM 15624]
MDDATPDADADPSVETESDASDAADEVAEPDEAETDAEWMDPADERILEYMQNEDVFEPNQFDEAKICPANFAAYRCRELAKYGLLKRHMPGVYEVTDAGERYLAGELDPSELAPEE